MPVSNFRTEKLPYYGAIFKIVYYAKWEAAKFMAKNLKNGQKKGHDHQPAKTGHSREKKAKNGRKWPYLATLLIPQQSYLYFLLHNELSRFLGDFHWKKSKDQWCTSSPERKRGTNVLTYQSGDCCPLTKPKRLQFFQDFVRNRTDL